jgi:hypothetical protein
VQRFTAELTKAIKTIVAAQPKPDIDSPVYGFIARLTPPALKAEISEAIKDASQAAVAISPSGSPTAAATPAHSEMMSRVNEAQRKED